MASQKKIIKILIASNLFFILVLLYMIFAKPANESYPLLSPQLSLQKIAELERREGKLTPNLYVLKERLAENNRYVNINYSIYIEDLNTGAWMGINEKQNFRPSSLMKIPIVAAVLKKVDNGELSMNSVVMMKENFLDNGSGHLYRRGYGYLISVYDLINYTIVYSDNTALFALSSILGEEGIVNTVYGMGLPAYSVSGTGIMNISTKDYSNILRSLYYSTYLKRPYSQFLLSMLANTNSTYGLVEGVPSNVVVAHKTGFWNENQQHHDCGIIYDPETPYILCMMTIHTSQEEANEFFRINSGIVYDYLGNQ